VLSIGKLGASAGQVEYYERQVAAGAEEYYAGRGELPGAWMGAGSAALGLADGGRVSRDGFMALMRGGHPVGGSVLRRMNERSKVAAIDLRFSAPKSVSVLFAVAGGGVSESLVDAHERAVNEALAYLEREACFTRRGHAGAERVRGDGFVAAAYRHRLSRAGDPQLHTHVVVANPRLTHAPCLSISRRLGRCTGRCYGPRCASYLVRDRRRSSLASISRAITSWPYRAALWCAAGAGGVLPAGHSAGRR
jgi:hypothetical protein